MTAGKMRRSGTVAGVISLTIAIIHLPLLYWASGFGFLFLGPIAFCASVVALVRGSWKQALRAKWPIPLPESGFTSPNP